jgi:NTP pyrophosphatase (non-canonical NTP hydrolase)
MYDYDDMRGPGQPLDPGEIDPVKSRKIRTSLYTASYYQHEASRTLIDEPDFTLTAEEMMILWNADGLAGEVGEMMDLVKKAIWHRHGWDNDNFRDKMKKELGDIQWYVAGLCTKLGFDLGDVMYTNIEKLKVRFPDGYEQEKTIVGKRLDEINHEGDEIEILGSAGFGEMSSELLDKYRELISSGKYLDAASLIMMKEGTHPWGPEKMTDEEVLRDYDEHVRKIAQKTPPAEGGVSSFVDPRDDGM